MIYSITGTKKLSVECKRELASEFKMKGLSVKHCFLRLEVWQRPNEIFLKQREYTVEILKDSG